MGGYFAWHPAPIPGGVRVFVTRGAADSIGRGTRAFAQQLLDDLGVKGQASGCKVDICRSAYFSDYPDPDEGWADRWPIVFRVQIPTRAAAKIRALSGPYVATEALDDGWRSADQYDEEASYPCLVVADFETRRAAARAQAAVEAGGWKALRAGLRLPPPKVSAGLARGRAPQLLVELGRVPPAFYEGGAAYAVQVQELCVRAGGRVHHQDESPRKRR